MEGLHEPFDRIVEALVDDPGSLEALRADGWAASQADRGDAVAGRLLGTGTRCFATASRSCVDLHRDGRTSRLLSSTASSTQTIWATTTDDELRDGSRALRVLSRTWHADARQCWGTDMHDLSACSKSSSFIQAESGHARGALLRVHPGDELPHRVRPGDELWGSDSDFESMQEISQEPAECPTLSSTQSVSWEEQLVEERRQECLEDEHELEDIAAESLRQGTRDALRRCAESGRLAELVALAKERQRQRSLESKPEATVDAERWMVVTSVSHEASLKASWVVPGANDLGGAPLPGLRKPQELPMPPVPPESQGPQVPQKPEAMPAGSQNPARSALALLAAARRASGRAGVTVGACAPLRVRRKRHKNKQSKQGAAPTRGFSLKLPPPVLIEHHHVHRHRHLHQHEVIEGEEEAAAFLASAPQVLTAAQQDLQRPVLPSVHAMSHGAAAFKERTPEGPKLLQKSSSLPVLPQRQVQVSQGIPHRPFLGTSQRSAPRVGGGAVQLPLLVAL